jgi:lysophospholipase L1-like esterase
MEQETNKEQDNENKTSTRKKLLFTSPIIFAGATIALVNKYKQTKKMKKYIEQAKENTKEIKRALILGDSVAKGYGSPNGGITNFLKEHLEKRFGNVHVMNEGILHLTSDGLLQKLVEEQAYDEQLSESNLVLINIGGNDLLKHYHENGPRAVMKNFFSVRSQYIKNLQQIIHYIETINPAITIVVNNLYNSLEKDYQYFGLTEAFINYWNASLKKFPVIQVNTKELGKNRELWADMVHPNQDGYQELSNLIIKQVGSILREDESKPETTTK